MYITVNGTDYELATNIGTIKRFEAKYNLPVTKVFEKLSNSFTRELVDALELAAKPKNPDFEGSLLDEWDYSDLFLAVQEFMIRLMFSGTPEQNEAKIEKYPAPEEQKNAFRAMLGLPAKEIPALAGSE